jgi:hypothetical protein
MKQTLKFVLAGCVAAGSSVFADEIDWSKLPPAATQANVSFANDIQPIFNNSCVRCHGAERAKAELRLDTLEGVMKGGEYGPVLNAGDSANSVIVKAVSQLDPEMAMPPNRFGRRRPGGPNAPAGGLDGSYPPNMPPPGGGPGGIGGPSGPNGPSGPGPDGQPAHRFGPPPKPLTAEQVGLIRAWIDQGAK